MIDHTSEPEDFIPLFDNLVARFDDESFVVEMLSIFVVDASAVADRLMSALMLYDADSIRNSLHSLKNILGTMQSGSLFQLAERTYEAFRNGNNALVHTNAAALVSETKRLVLAADEFLCKLREAATQ